MTSGFARSPFPPASPKTAKARNIVVTVEGGNIQHVEIQDGTALVEVHDYDTEGTSEPGDIERDPDGTPYLRGIWTKPHSRP